MALVRTDVIRDEIGFRCHLTKKDALKGASNSHTMTIDNRLSWA